MFEAQPIPARFPYPFSIIQSAKTGFNVDLARGPTCRMLHNRQRARRRDGQQAGKNSWTPPNIGPSSVIRDLVLISFTRVLFFCHSLGGYYPYKMFGAS